MPYTYSDGAVFAARAGITFYFCVADEGRKETLAFVFIVGYSIAWLKSPESKLTV